MPPSSSSASPAFCNIFLCISPPVHPGGLFMPFRYKTYRISFLTHKYNLIMYILVKVLMHLCPAAYQAATLCVRYEINLGLSTVSISSQGHSGFAVPSASLTCYAASATKQSRRCIAPPVNQNCPIQSWFSTQNHLCVVAIRQLRSVFGKK